MDLPKLPEQGALPKFPKPPSLAEAMATRPVPQEQAPITPPAITTPDSVEEKKHETDNFGWLKNMPKSLFDMTKSVVYDLPKAVLTSAVTYAKDPDQYRKDLNLAFAKNNGLGRMFREQMVDYYTNDFWHNFNEDPAHFLGDLAAVASLGGGTLAKAGELSRVVEVARLGKNVANVAHYIDPVSLVGKAASKAAAPILEGLGFGKYTPELNAARAALAAKASIDMNAEVAKHVFSNLSDIENSKLLRLIKWGDRGEIAAAEALNDTVAKRFRLWKDAITGGDEPLFKDMHLLNDAEIKRSHAVKMSEYSQQHFQELGLQRPVSAKEAMAMIDAGTHNPTFLSSYRLKSQANDLAEALNKPFYRGGMLSRFERITGGGKNMVEDVNALMARQIASKHDALYKIHLAKIVDQIMAEKGLRVFVGEGAEKVHVPEGYAPLQGAFYEKYWGDYAKAGGKSTEIIQDFMNKGLSPMEAIKAAKVAFEGDPEIAASLSSRGQVYVPKHVAYWMNRELAPISQVGRMYDQWLGRFKGLATVLNPKFWGSVVFGNAILGLVYGISPDYARIMYKYRDFLPLELKQATRAEYFLNQLGVYDRLTNKMGGWASRLDNMFRNPMFAQQLGKDGYVRMKVAGGNFVMSQNQIMEAVKYFGKAPERLMETRLAINKLNTEIAAGFKDANITARQQETLGQAISRAAAREGPRKSAPGYDILGRKIETAPELYPKGSGKSVVPKTVIEETPSVDAVYGPEREVAYTPIKEKYFESREVSNDPITGETQRHALSNGERAEVIKQFTAMAEDMATMEKALGAVKDNPELVLRANNFPLKAHREGAMALEGLSGKRAEARLTELMHDLKDRQFQGLIQGFNDSEAIRNNFDELVRYKMQRKTPLPGETQPFEFGQMRQGDIHEKLPDQYALPQGDSVKLGPTDTSVDPITGLQVEMQPELYGAYEPGKPLTPQQERLVQATNRYGNIEDTLKSKREDVIHRLAEIGELQKRVPELVADAAAADRAIEVGNRFYGSYLRLSPFERKTLRRVLPFYTFNKAMTMLAFKFPFLYPKRAFIGAHLAQAWNDLMSDENSYLPARLRDYVPVMARPDGSVVAISAGYLNPLSSAKVGDFAELPLPSVFNPLKSNPVIALVLKMNGAIPEWSGKPLSPGEYATRLDNGTVVQWTGKGFRTAIAQPSVFKSLFDLFPQSQLIDRLVHPFAQSDRGWLFHPDPILGPDGKPRYPKELLDLVLSNVIPTNTYNIDEIKNTERAKMNAVIKSYVKDLRFATPVRREQILEILRGWQIEKNRKWVQ